MLYARFFSIRSAKTIEPQPAHDWARAVEIEFNAILYNAAGKSLQLTDGYFGTRLDIYNGQ